MLIKFIVFFGIQYLVYIDQYSVIKIIEIVGAEHWLLPDEDYLFKTNQFINAPGFWFSIK